MNKVADNAELDGYVLSLSVYNDMWCAVDRHSQTRLDE